MKLIEELYDSGHGTYRVQYYIDSPNPVVLLDVPDDGEPVLISIIRALRSEYPILDLSMARKVWQSREIRTGTGN